MLIQFSVENFLSIKDKVVLSLLASKDNEHPEHLIMDGSRNENLLYNGPQRYSSGEEGICGRRIAEGGGSGD